MSSVAPGKQWGQSVDWRATMWSKLLERIPEQTMSTFYMITAPEVFEVLSMEQLEIATKKFKNFTVRRLCGILAVRVVHSVLTSM